MTQQHKLAICLVFARSIKQRTLLKYILYFSEILILVWVLLSTKQVCNQSHNITEAFTHRQQQDTVHPLPIQDSKFS